MAFLDFDCNVLIITVRAGIHPAETFNLEVTDRLKTSRQSRRGTHDNATTEGLHSIDSPFYIPDAPLPWPCRDDEDSD
ncbi:unnamed protein product [Protopolystoma xenopodis]|uniref:Uncharacterized protein n=1 Tax=Protopolystoma xenopodis TaxID=117903 RepID=A0A448XEU3_9PLAT|nr:unnamed protein product [Protopolystoma xenopodis]